MNRTLPLVLMAHLATAGAAWAAAPPPTKPVSITFYSGRWYEIARIPNAGQRNCHAAYSQFIPSATGIFRVNQVCRRGSSMGPARTVSAKGRILPGSKGARFELSFFGGLRKQEYWVVDRADDLSWGLMATPGGNYIWLLSREPVLDPAARAGIVARVRTLGYRQALEFPAQPPA